MIKECQKGDIDNALARIGDLWDKGYSAVDIVVTVFRVVKGMEDLPEYTKLEYIRVSSFQLRLPPLACQGWARADEP